MENSENDIWTVQRILGWIEGYLAQHEDAAARASAQWLVSEALGVSRMQLFLDGQRPLTPDERATLRSWTRRRATGEPVQYITGQTAFRHITVSVRPGVLIPRPETEVLVSEALALLPAAPKPQDDLDDELIRRYVALGGELNGGIESEPVREPGGELQGVSERGLHGDSEGDSSLPANTSRDSAPVRPKRAESTLLVADICTGTGCIACSIASEHPATRVIATDLSPAAVALAAENRDALGLENRIELFECDLGSGIDESLLGAFDLVVSNPPYVPSSVLAEIPREVADYEPALALDGGEDGLDVFRRLLAWSARALKPGGAFAFELHETCLDEASALARRAGFADVRIVRDLAGRPRVLTARTRQPVA